MPKYLHKAFDILESPATRNAFSQRSTLCYLQFEREDVALPKPSPLLPRHILQGMYAIRVINENSLRFYVSSVLTKWQSICYSRCFHVIPIGKSQSFESKLLFSQDAIQYWKAASCSLFIHRWREILMACCLHSNQVSQCNYFHPIVGLTNHRFLRVFV